jgi:hypothetical protein
MRKYDMVFIQALNKFHTTIENTKDVQFINLICNQQQPNSFFYFVFILYKQTCVKIQ